MDGFYLNVNNKLKILTLLSVLSVSLILLTVVVASYSFTGPSSIVLYSSGIYLGSLVLALWINAEAKSVSSQIKLYLFEDGAEAEMDSQLFITQHSPGLIGFFSVLSVLMYF